MNINLDSMWVAFGTMNGFNQWCALWLGWGLVWLVILGAGIAYGLFAAVATSLNHLLGAFNIWIRGWPPAHLDAYGDWKPEPKLEEEST